MVDLDEPTLDKLAHDIGHLGGNLMVVVQKLGGLMITENPEIVVVDEDFLSGQQTGSFRTLATTGTPPSGPPSKE